MEHTADRDSALAAAADLVARHTDDVWTLTGGALEDPKRREALIAIIVDAWGTGYATGLRKGGRAMADAIVERATR